MWQGKSVRGSLLTRFTCARKSRRAHGGWEQGMATFCKPFTTAKFKYFDHTQLTDATQWLAE
ncbi:MAG: STAS/SEC14 domain-containing protein [Pirellulales bacterium]